MRSVTLGALVFALALGGCNREKPSDLETRLHTLEQRVSEQQEFIDKAKEVLASHRAHILDLENRVQVTSHPLAPPPALPTKP